MRCPSTSEVRQVVGDEVAQRDGQQAGAHRGQPVRRETSTTSADQAAQERRR